MLHVPKWLSFVSDFKVSDKRKVGHLPWEYYFDIFTTFALRVTETLVQGSVMSHQCYITVPHWRLVCNSGVFVFSKIISFYTNLVL